MQRRIAITWEASFLVIAGVLYFLFVLPRWHELSGDWSHTLGTVMRIVAGLLVGLAALPVVFTLLKTRKPEYGTPALALSLRFWSVVLHVLAGVLIVGAAVAEIWLSLDSAGPYLFGIYGAAAAIALLGAFAFYLAYVAEKPPPPPKPLKAKEPRGRRGKAVKAGNEDTEETEDTEDEVDDAVTTSDDKAEDTKEAETPDSDEAETPQVEASETAEEPTGKLQNRRPAGKTGSRLRRRSRGGVAVED